MNEIRRYTLRLFDPPSAENKVERRFKVDHMKFYWHSGWPKLDFQCDCSESGSL